MAVGVPVRIGIIDFDPAEGISRGQGFNVHVEMDEAVDLVDGQEIRIGYGGAAALGVQGPTIEHIEAPHDTLSFLVTCPSAGDLTITATTDLEDGPQSVAGTVTIA